MSHWIYFYYPIKIDIQILYNKQSNKYYKFNVNNRTTIWSSAIKKFY